MTGVHILAVCAIVVAAVATAWGRFCTRALLRQVDSNWQGRHESFLIGRQLGGCELGERILRAPPTRTDAYDQALANLREARRAAIRAGFGSHLERMDDE